tara:strand:- start:27 stop:389 length:363 start_codon:yes stop_codon:yes gene_type:complete
MALGNANNSAQARGKNKPIIVKRRKEVVLGKSLNTISIDTTLAPNGNVACKLNNSNANTVVYHDGPSANRVLLGTKVYTIPRVNDRFTLANGFYHFDDGRGGFGYFEITSGAINSIDRCP